jgi:hypothetical protein
MAFTPERSHRLISRSFDEDRYLIWAILDGSAILIPSAPPIFDLPAHTKGTERDTGLWHRRGTNWSLTWGWARADTTCRDRRILSPLRSQTQADTEGPGETKLRFYRGLGASEGTGKDRERPPVAVRIALKKCVLIRNTFRGN